MTGLGNLSVRTGRINDFELMPLSLPRRRNIPRRLDDGPAANTSPGTPEDLFRVQFFKVIDSALVHLDEEFQSTDLGKYNKYNSTHRWKLGLLRGRQLSGTVTVSAARAYLLSFKV